MASPPPRTVEDSADYLAAIIGNESQRGQRVQAGPILQLMYDAAVSVAWRHSGQRSVLLGIDRIDLTRVISHMDLVRLDGRLVEVGNSSMVIEVRASVQRPWEREFQPSHVGYITMVAVDEHGRAVRDIPKLSYDTPLGSGVKALAEHRRAQITERRQALEWINADDRLRVDDVMEPFRPERYEYLTPEQTQVRVKRQIAPAAFQDDFRIKGGEFLAWLDQVASYTARRFARNDNVITISVNDILFQHPLHVDDRIELSARVVYVRTHTLEVTIDITVDGRDGTTQNMDSIDFFIFNFDESGLKKKITSGLVLDEPDQESLRRYMLARTRYNFWKSNPESHLAQSPE